MASAAGRRNILRELNESASPTTSNGPNANLPLTPTSPDEEVIKLRGRRKVVLYDLNESPVKLPYRSPLKKTPVKRLATPTKLPTAPVRSSPRKRLNMTMETSDFDESALDEMVISSRRTKRPRLHNLAPNGKIPLEKGVLALTHAQLAELVGTAAKTCPEMKEVLVKLMPAPDLLSVEHRLYFFQRNVFKAYPRNVWGSQDDAYCYLRIRTHIDTFKKECLEHCRLLVESENWLAVIEYVLIAWGYAKGLPQWSTAAHNRSKETCIRQLTAHFMNAIKKVDLDPESLQDIIERMKELDMDDEIKVCISAVAKMIEKDC